MAPSAPRTCRKSEMPVDRALSSAAPLGASDEISDLGICRYLKIFVSSNGLKKVMGFVFPDFCIALAAVIMNLIGTLQSLASFRDQYFALCSDSICRRSSWSIRTIRKG